MDKSGSINSYGKRLIAVHNELISIQSDLHKELEIYADSVEWKTVRGHDDRLDYYLDNDTFIKLLLRSQIRRIIDDIVFNLELVARYEHDTRMYSNSRLIDYCYSHEL